MSKTSLTDDVLIRQVISGDVELFADLIVRHTDHVRRIVSGHVRPDMVDEVSHDVFVRAYVSLATYSFKMPFQHWLATVAVRTCYEAWRKLAARPEVPSSGMGQAPHQWADTLLRQQSTEAFETMVRQREARDVLQTALALLSPENRVVLTLVHLEGRSIREAAELLGWSTINVKVRAHRARQQLRKVIEGFVEEEA